MMHNKVIEAVRFIQEHISDTPDIGLVLGSGLGVFADQIETPVAIRYEDIPHFPVSTVAGHAGQFVYGKLYGKKVLAMQGRFHFYEGYSMQEVVFPIRVMKMLGTEHLILTNAAGGVNMSFHAGDLMLITDHYNNMGTNPLIGPNDDTIGDRFPDMSAVYDKAFIEVAKATASALGIQVQEGVYAANTGPVYETPAEVKALRILGIDAVGMSTVPEAIVARHAGMRVLGISCITNMAAGILDVPLSHDEVMTTASNAQDQFIKLLGKIIETIE